MPPVLSLVTGTMNRPESFERLVRSIAERTRVPWELVVSDASHFQYAKAYGSKYPGQIKVREEVKREGCVKAYNWCFKNCTGEWVIWLNDDAEVMPGYDVAAINYMERHPSIGLGALYYAECHLPYMINSWFKMVYANFGIISRTLGEEIGWMDEVVHMYGNDNSIAFRVLLAGLGIGSVPGSKIWHHSVQDEDRIRNQESRVADARALVNKYQYLLPEMQEVYSRTSNLIGPMILHD